MKYDMVIIGAGPAGISAAVYAKSRGLNVLLLEKKQVGGLIGNVSTVTHYAGIIEKETGATFANRLKEQALGAGVEIVYEEVMEVELTADVKKIKTDKSVYEAAAVILANGTTPRKLDIPGEAALSGNGIGLNAARDGKRYEGKNIYVVGGADGAIKEAIYLAQFAKKLTIIHFEEKLGAIAEFMRKLDQLPNLEVRLNTRLTGVFGDDHVERLELTSEKTAEKEIIEDDGCGIFVYAGSIPNTGLYTELKSEDGFLTVNARMETEIPGVYAAGDICVKQVRQVATAAADGAIAAINACNYIKSKSK
ncbi:MAG: FAD-binding protein [Lachnospiraceae bacterium]|nr:FAD-binding protein [Lachnospiraceae bacterium]